MTRAGKRLAGIEAAREAEPVPIRIVHQIICEDPGDPANPRTPTIINGRTYYYYEIERGPDGTFPPCGDD